MKINNWIFVTGAPRSGTTFVGKVLSLPMQVDYIHEPFNPTCGMPGIDQRYLYLRPASQNALKYEPLIRNIFDYNFSLKTGYYRNDKPLQKIIKKITGSRGPFYLRLAKLNPFHNAAIIKDPIGCLMTEFLSKTFNIKSLVLIRHPVAFVASTMRLNWDDELDLKYLLQQPDLVDDYFSEDIDFLKSERSSHIEKASALWRALNKVLLKQSSQNADWKILTHEALSQSPLETFRELYETFNLPWSQRIENVILDSTSSKNMVEASKGTVQQFSRDSSKIFDMRSKMLTLDQRKTIYEITSDVALQVYPSSSFSLEI